MRRFIDGIYSLGTAFCISQSRSSTMNCSCGDFVGLVVIQSSLRLLFLWLGWSIRAKSKESSKGMHIGGTCKADYLLLNVLVGQAMGAGWEGRGTGWEQNVSSMPTEWQMSCGLLWKMWYKAILYSMYYELVWFWSQQGLYLSHCTVDFLYSFKFFWRRYVLIIQVPSPDRGRCRERMPILQRQLQLQGLPPYKWTCEGEFCAPLLFSELHFFFLRWWI